MRLSVRFPNVDPSTRLHAVHDALLWYLRRPERYRPACARLDVFLGHVVECRLKDALRSDMRTRRRETAVDPEMLERVGDVGCVNLQTSDGLRDLRGRLLGLVRSRTERVFIDAYLRGASQSRLARIIRFRSDPVGTATELIGRVIKRLHQRAIRMSSDSVRVKSTGASE
ncbi:MAG TPA: hypothetical protein VMO26_07370 [Vicinamibacterales bacterium]|nr:hypothetical protein [Vicinamibacterales bacterium]